MAEKLRELKLTAKKLSTLTKTILYPEIVVIDESHWDNVIKLLSRNPDDLHQVNPRFFEELIAEIMRRKGFDVEVTQAQKDGGRDILARMKTPLGQHLWLVECKRYRPYNPVGVKLVRELFGIVEEEKATAGVIVTTSRFTRNAIEFQHLVQVSRYAAESPSFHLYE